MSKLLDILDKIDRGAPSPMGFGAAARGEKVPPIALVGLISRNSGEDVSILERIEADVALIEGPADRESLKKLAAALGKVPWGMRFQKFTERDVQRSLKAGCDFLALAPEQAPLGALGDEEIAYFLTIAPDMDERSLRAVQELPVDGVLLSLGSMHRPLTLQHLISVGTVRANLSKYLLLETSTELSVKELEGLRDLGVDGLVVDVSATSEDALAKLKESIMEVPRQRRKQEGKSSAVLPHSGHDPAEEQDPDEEEPPFP